MATPILSTSIFTTKQCFSYVFVRSFASLSVKAPPSSLSSISLSYISLLRPMAALAVNFNRISPATSTIRYFATRQTTSSFNDSNPNLSNRPPNETILLEGCDFEHWLIVMEKPQENLTRDEIIDSYIKTLATVVGSEDKARMKIYSVSTRNYFAFGALISEELSYKMKELEKVRWVLPDSYLDVKNKDYGEGNHLLMDRLYHMIPNIMWSGSETMPVQMREIGAMTDLVTLIDRVTKGEEKIRSSRTNRLLKVLGPTTWEDLQIWDKAHKAWEDLQIWE